MNTERKFTAPGELDVERRIQFHDRRVGPSQSEMQITGIKAAITSYYLDLDARKHGGVAQDHAFAKIQRIVGMTWDDHKAQLKG